MRGGGYHSTANAFLSSDFLNQLSSSTGIPSKNQTENRFSAISSTPPTRSPRNLYTLRKGKQTIVNPKYTLTDHLWEYLQAYAAKHRAAGNGFGYSCFGPQDTARTLSARYHKDGSEILIKQSRRNPRRLTPRECARLMGFDRRNPQTGKWGKAWPAATSQDTGPMKIPVSDTRAYRQFGNAVVVPVVSSIAQLIISSHGIRSVEDLRKVA